MQQTQPAPGAVPLTPKARYDDTEETAWLSISGGPKGKAQHKDHADEYIVLDYDLGIEKGVSGTASKFSLARFTLALDAGCGDLMLGKCAPPIETADADEQEAGAADKVDAVLTILGGAKIELTGCRIMSANISGAVSTQGALVVDLAYDKITMGSKSWDIRKGEE